MDPIIPMQPDDPMGVETEAEARPWERLGALIDGGDAAAVEAFLESLSTGDVGRAVSRLDEEHRVRLLAMLASDDAATLVDLLPEAAAVEFLTEVEPEVAARILDQMPSDEQADLIGQIDDAEAEAILAKMAPEEAEDARRLTKYADDVAGGIMITEFLAYPSLGAVGDVIADLRANAERYARYDVQYIYVTDERGRLEGVLRLRDLVLTPSQRRLSEIMLPTPHTLTDTEELSDIRTFFDRHTFFGAPVVDKDGRLVGVVTRAALEEAVAERSDSDFRNTQGILGGDELRSMPLATRTKRRFAWLAVNIGLNVMAASVIAAYESTLEAVIALGVLLPIISDMSGNSGNQAVAVTLRELALGLVGPKEAWHVLKKEVSVGVINGILLGILIAIAAWLWKGNGWLGFVAGVALCINTIVSVALGGVVPLLFKRWKMDPAVASGPILTTVTDMCGFFLVLSLAAAMLDKLT